MEPNNSKNSDDKDEGDEDASVKPGSNIPKTPVSILQELYVRKGITPKYDLVQIEGAVHEPTFKYRVTVGDLVSKTEAELLNIPNFGKKSIDEVKERLTDRNLALRGDD